jgi:hypothetical protein
VPQSNWVRDLFRRCPLTASLIAINLLTWLGGFFGQHSVGNLALSDLRHAPWTLLTYPLYTPQRPIWFLFTLYVLHWIGRDLEPAWGTRKFAAVALALTMVCGLSLNLLPPLLGVAGLPLAGLEQPLTALFVMWAMLNPMATVLFMMIIPIQARVLGYATLVLIYFDTGPILGFFALLGPLLGWLYVYRSRSVRVKPRPKQKLRVIEGGRKDAPTAPRKVSFQPSMSELEVDRILEKIQKDGMVALTPEEKSTLESHSRRLRDN